MGKRWKSNHWIWKKPITDKDVSDQVEKILNERFKELKEGQTNTEKPNETTTEVPNKETTGTTENRKTIIATTKVQLQLTIQKIIQRRIIVMLIPYK